MIALRRAGDITNDGKNQYLYNADGKICAVEWTYNSITVMTGYIYDAEGNRVAKGAISSWSCDPSANGFTTQADYVLDQAGHQLSEFVPGQGGAMAWQHTNVYASGELIATDDTTETHFYLNDWLGTRRVQTDYQGVVEQTCSSLPYGDRETCSPPPSGILFTGKVRDPESGNDYFGARYYASSMGRFLSPDWSAKAEPVPYAKLDNPQSLSLYDYMRDNPLGGVDPDGYDFWDKLNNVLHGRGWQNTPPPPPVSSPPPPTPHWQYSQSARTMTLNVGNRVVALAGKNGYSGNGKGLNNPNMQDVKNKGPIPRGKWNIGPQKDHVEHLPGGRRKTLKAAMVLTPDNRTNTFNRHNFLLHGDNSQGNHSASQGCIVMCRPARNQIGGSGVDDLEVVR